MKVSATEEHGLRCLMRLAIAWKAGESVTIPEVARCEGMSPPYAAKLVAMLRRAALVRSVRGVKGGVGLSRAPESITLTEAMSALAGSPVRTGPCMGPEGVRCDRQGTCGLRGVWDRVTTVVTGVLDGVTLADLVANGRSEAGGGESRSGVTAPARWSSEPRA
jgi:Rrf2 family protein